ncbi:MAG: hypothetical protein COB67_05385 [SAR324 cluster bacterium]|uniref:Uncharacterized protein n=1 Tax=SAR324 cluster bacterium TaxID=2024889 RepID=A0A2A4T5E2_9DELT|nr:MAG: hypothetical protein COB67_05385 [SAR324 cluster bacterium]
MQEKIEERVIELEIRVAYQDETIEQLNDVVAQQQTQIDLLQRQMSFLAASLKQPSLKSDSEEESPPPHY